MVRRVARGGAFLLLMVGSLLYRMVVWYGIVEGVPMLIMMALLLLTAFSAIFSVLTYCNDLCSCSCPTGYITLCIVTAWFCCGGGNPKCLSNALSNTSSMSLLRELICSAEKPGIVI